MFDPTSRYAKLPTFIVIDRRGRAVEVVEAAPAPGEPLAGYHLRKQGQRVDHLAHRYLGDAAQAWRIWEAGDVMSPDALAESAEIPIPRRG